MSLSLSHQGWALLLSLTMGAGIGLLYDILRPARRHSGAALARLTGEETIPAEGTARRERGGSQAAPGSGQETGEGLARQVMDSRTPLPGYAQRMVRRSKPNMEQKSTAAGPGQ